MLEPYLEINLPDELLMMNIEEPTIIIIATHLRSQNCFSRCLIQAENSVCVIYRFE